MLLALIGCQTKECTEWYSGIKLTPVTSINNGNEMIENWYVADFLENELNLEVTFYSSADGYEECKSKTRIHDVVRDSIFINCDNYLIIGNDTVSSYSSLTKYFNLNETKGHYLFEYSDRNYNFPTFEYPENTFYIEVLLSDNQILIDSCVVKIN